MRKRVTSSRQRFTAGKEIFGTQGAVPGRMAKRSRSSGRLVVEFLCLLKGQVGPVVLALSTLTLATGLALIPPAATKFLIDYVLIDAPLPDSAPQWLPRNRFWLLASVTGGVAMISLVKLAFHIWGRWSATRVVKRLQMTVRKKVFAHAVRLPLHRIHELKSGGVASILREDGGSVGDLVFGMLYNPWRAIIQLLGSLAVLCWIDWRLLLGALILVPMVFVTHRTWINRIRPQYRRIRQQRQSIDAYASEVFGGMRVVRAFSGQRRESLKFMTENHLMGRQELRVWWWSRAIELIWEALIPVGSACLLMYGGWQVLQDRLTIGDLMMFLVYLLMLLEPLGVLAQSAAQFQNSLSGLDRVLELLDEPLEMQAARPKAVNQSGEHPTPVVAPSDHSSREPGMIRGAIDVDGVSFQYPGADRLVLDSIRFQVLPGQTVALVGPSGAGKSTLCNLIARFYDPTSGCIRLDDIDIREFGLNAYRNLLGMVEQDVFLFDGTISENIGYSKRDADSTSIRRAATLANADEFIQLLPDGYESLIGERGVKLSGGQRQRVAIARAVLADPPILILDEATSNLDSHSERLIQRGLESLMQGRTSFVIAHRLSTIRNADKIIVLDQGQIREMGTHAELVKSGQVYREMLRVQLHDLSETDETLTWDIDATPGGRDG